MKGQRTVLSTCEDRSYTYTSIHLQDVDKELMNWTLWPRLCSVGLVEFIWTRCQNYAGSWTAKNCFQGTLLPLLLESQTLRSDAVSKMDASCTCTEERETETTCAGSYWNAKQERKILILWVNCPLRFNGYGELYFRSRHRESGSKQQQLEEAMNVLFSYCMFLLIYLFIYECWAQLLYFLKASLKWVNICLATQSEFWTLFIKVYLVVKSPSCCCAFC